MADARTTAPTFVAETEALLRLAVLAARVEDGLVTFPGFADGRLRAREAVMIRVDLVRLALLNAARDPSRRWQWLALAAEWRRG